MTPAKPAHLRAAARAYLARLAAEPHSCRFDVVALRMEPGGELRDLRVFKDAFV